MEKEYIKKNKRDRKIGNSSKVNGIKKRELEGWVRREPIKMLDPCIDYVEYYL